MGFAYVLGKPIYLHELPSRKPEDIMAAVRGAIKMQACATTPGENSGAAAVASE